ncbi:MAG: hypothetical protein Q7S92_06455 [Candidatus Diapherotrites archaeon]|nr:hypothetical protein [Candidatus Diapherotrites archaeon]
MPRTPVRRLKRRPVGREGWKRIIRNAGTIAGLAGFTAAGHIALETRDIDQRTSMIGHTARMKRDIVEQARPKPKPGKPELSPAERLRIAREQDRQREERMAKFDKKETDRSSLITRIRFAHAFRSPLHAFAEEVSYRPQRFDSWIGNPKIDAFLLGLGEKRETARGQALNEIQQRLKDLADKKGKGRPNYYDQRIKIIADIIEKHSGS